MSWNYRVVQKEGYCVIHEVYYCDDKIRVWSEKPVSPFGDCHSELACDVELMKLAFEKPTLIEKDDTLVELEAT